MVKAILTSIHLLGYVQEFSWIYAYGFKFCWLNGGWGVLCSGGSASQEGPRRVRWNAPVSHQASRTRFGSFRRKELEDSFHKPSWDPVYKEALGPRDKEHHRVKREREMGARVSPCRELQEKTFWVEPHFPQRHQQQWHSWNATSRSCQGSDSNKEARAELGCFWTWDI